MQGQRITKKEPNRRKEAFFLLWRTSNYLSKPPTYTRAVLGHSRSALHEPLVRTVRYIIHTRSDFVSDPLRVRVEDRDQDLAFAESMCEGPVFEDQLPKDQ